eukprot:4564190-Ditylum_brightwellii.AAC.1
MWYSKKTETNSSRRMYSDPSSRTKLSGILSSQSGTSGYSISSCSPVKSQSSSSKVENDEETKNE